jgi:hypothetical protein
MKRYPTDPRLWLLAIGLGVGLVVLEGYLLRAYWLVWNGLILLFGLFLGLLALNGRFALGLATMYIGVGLGAHGYEYWNALSIGRCDSPGESGWIDWVVAVDRCLYYSEPWVLSAQALLIGGVLVISVKLGSLLRTLIRRNRHWA